MKNHETNTIKESWSYMNKINILDSLVLHDCVIEGLEWNENNLILYFENIDVLPTHPNNPYKVAKRGEQAKLTFKNCIATKIIRYDSNKPQNSDIIEMNLEDFIIDFEVLEVKRRNNDNNKLIYTVFGQCAFELNNDFGEFTLTFESVTVKWEKLKEDSWFVNF